MADLGSERSKTGVASPTKANLPTPTSSGVDDGVEIENQQFFFLIRTEIEPTGQLFAS